MVKKDDTSSTDAARDRIGQDISKEIQELRADVAALVASLKDYGALGAGELKNRAQGLPDEAVADSLRNIKELRQQVEGLQDHLEKDVRAHPLAWMAGALGLGVLFGLFLSRRD
jgi:ElaB/YqjD/DUF883 family membrane-anchored ribosome-binding protein